MTSFSITPGLRAFGRASSIAPPRVTTCRRRRARIIYCVPAFTVPDNVTNNEIGWKTEWFDHRLQFNGAVYQEIWSNAQTGFFDPQGGLGNLAFATNGPSYRVRGVEPSIIARVTHGLTVQASAAWNSSCTDELALPDRQRPGDGPTYGQPITSIPNPYGPIGSPTSYSPPFSANARVRYEWAFNDYNAFVQVGGSAPGSHGHGHRLRPGVRYTADIRATTPRSAWRKTRGPWRSSAEHIERELQPVERIKASSFWPKFPQRPRVLGIKISYKFSGASSEPGRSSGRRRLTSRRRRRIVIACKTVPSSASAESNELPRLR